MSEPQEKGTAPRTRQINTGEAEPPIVLVEGDRIGNRYRIWTGYPFSRRMDYVHDCLLGFKDKSECRRIERLMELRMQHERRNPQLVKRGIPGLDMPEFKGMDVFCQKCIVAQRPPTRWERLMMRLGRRKRISKDKGSAMVTGLPAARRGPERVVTPIKASMSFEQLQALDPESSPASGPSTEPFPQDMLLIEDPPAEPRREMRQESGGNVQENAPQQPGTELVEEASNTTAGGGPAPAPEHEDPVVAEVATKAEAPAGEVPVDGHFHSPGNKAEGKVQEPIIEESPEIQGRSRESGISPAAAAGPAPEMRHCDKCGKDVPIKIWGSHQGAHTTNEARWTKKEATKKQEKAKGKKKPKGRR